MKIGGLTISGCLDVEFHQRGSDTKLATPSSLMT